MANTPTALAITSLAAAKVVYNAFIVVCWLLMPHSKARRILFVDDEPSIRATLPPILRYYGFNITIAATVAQAIQEIQTHEFDLLLCDLNIQQANDGYKIVRAMQERNPRCVTVILTAYPGVETAIEGIHLGVDDYIIKPTSADVLVALLAEKLAARGPKACILSVSYYEPLAKTFQMLLEREGYEVVSTLTFEASIKTCEQGNFDMLILGHSIPLEEKLQIVEHFRRTCPAPIISLRPSAGETQIHTADFQIDPDPKVILETVTEIVRGKIARTRTAS